MTIRNMKVCADITGSDDVVASNESWGDVSMAVEFVACVTRVSDKFVGVDARRWR